MLIRKLFPGLMMIVLLLAFSAGAAFSQIKVACVGNSITEGAGLGDSTYPKELQRLMGSKYEVRNYGLGGRTLLKKGDHPYWNEPKYQEVLQWNPDIVVIMLGTNDSKPWNWKYKDDFFDNYKEFVASFKSLSSHPKIYVCYPIPVFKDRYGIRDSIVKNDEPPLIRRAAREEKVHVIDLYKDMKPYGKDSRDGVHPNKIGAVIMARFIYRKIK